ncbi:MAG: hypothetical protein QM736_27250 [Vicinamibacterales bacterium]
MVSFLWFVRQSEPRQSMRGTSSGFSFEGGFSYVFDADGDKVRIVRFRGAGNISPTTMFFGPGGRLLVTPGLHEYKVDD